MIERIGATLLHSLWQGTLVAAWLGIALLFARRAPARTRYALALTALALLGAAPLVTFATLAPTEAATAGPAAWSDALTVSGPPAPEGPMPVLVAFWAVGVAVLSLRLAGGLVRMEVWRRRATPAPPEWQARAEALAARLGTVRRFALLVSDRVEVPSAWGVLRPVVAVPVGFLTGTAPAQVEAILLHELAHLRRFDPLVHLLQAVLETVLFFHPAVWWVSSVVRREREHRCDDEAVAVLGDPIPYARALLGLEERRARPPRPALAATENSLMNRIARLLAPAPASRRLSPLVPALAAGAVIAAALGGATVVRAQTAPPPPPKPAVAKPATPVRNAAGRARDERLAKKRAAELARLARLETELAALRRRLGMRSDRYAAQEAQVVRTQQMMLVRINDERRRLESLREAVEVRAARVRAISPDARTIAPAVAVRIERAKVLASDAERLRLAADGIRPVVPPSSGLGRPGTLPPLAGDGALAPAGVATLPAPAPPTLGVSGVAVPPSSWGTDRIVDAPTLAVPPSRDAVVDANILPPADVRPRTLTGRAFARFAPLGLGAPSATVRFQSGRASVDVQDALFSRTVADLARAAGKSVVIPAGRFPLLTVVLTDLSFEDALRSLCRAANATFRREGGVYYVTPK